MSGSYGKPSPRSARQIFYRNPSRAMIINHAIRMLVVEDHAALALNLSEFFDDKRYILDFASDGLTALRLVATQTYDVIILDVMLPGLSGFEVCRRIRKELHCPTPILFMTSKDQLSDKEEGFIAGGDDYLVKPFKLRELQLRVEALYRRRSAYAKTREIQGPGICFDLGTFTVTTDTGEKLELSGTGARIFEELIKAYPNILSYAEIQDSVWGEREVDINTLRTHVYSLRKLLQDRFQRPLIKTIHGRGYRLISFGNGSE